MESLAKRALEDYQIGEVVFECSVGPVRIGSVNAKHGVVGMHFPRKTTANWTTYPHDEMEKWAREFALENGCMVCYCKETNAGDYIAIDQNGNIQHYDWFPDEDPRFLGLSAIPPPLETEEQS